MSVDLQQFHQVFFEESFEGLDIMESQLIDIDVDDVDEETVNTIFRAAHSIKGGAGTFGFMNVSEFTHVVETLLDEIRSGQRVLLRAHIDIFLQSVDCLREMLESLQAGAEIEEERPVALKKEFEQFLAQPAAGMSDEAAAGTAGEGTVDAAADSASDSSPDNSSDSSSGKAAEGGVAQVVGWQVTMRPDANMLRWGNEPFRMFRELAEVVGEDVLTVEADISQIPSFGDLDPESCHLNWTLNVAKGVDKKAIETVFEWVEDDCEFDYQPIMSTAPVAPADHLAEPPAAESKGEDSQTAEASTASTPENTPQTSTDTVEKPAESATKKAPADKPAAVKKTAGKGSENSSIRVSIDKVDSLINMVGELVITQSMLGQLGNDFDISRLGKLLEGLSQLEQNTRELQESVMKIRMMPISFAFSRFPRLVRDLGSKLSKTVNLVTLGENTELDKTVMEKIGDPLVHLVRNSLDHGLETTEERVAKGKQAEGTITLNAYHQGGNIVIEVSDDGAGLNESRILEKAIQNGLIPENNHLTPEEIHHLIFLPGFSTADAVSDISGRGVGMDVVRKNINALNGTIEVRSEREVGSTFIIRLPLTLAILDGQLVRVCNETYIFPLVSIVESIQVNRRDLSHVTGSQYLMQLRDEYIPIIRLDHVFSLRSEDEQPDDIMLVVVEGDNEKIGLVVDDLLGQQQVVIKSLEQNYQRVNGISGATILGDGTVALIIDISGIGKTVDSPQHRERIPSSNQAA